MPLIWFEPMTEDYEFLFCVSLQGLLAFYGFPLPNSRVEVTTEEPTSLPVGVKFELQSLPVRKIFFLTYQFVFPLSLYCVSDVSVLLFGNLGGRKSCL